MQNTFKNDRKMAVCVQFREHVGVGNQLRCAPQAVPLQQAPIPACTNTLLREEFGGNRTDFSRAGCLSTQPAFPLCGIFVKMLICLWIYIAYSVCKLCGVAFYIFLYANQHIHQGSCDATLLLTPKLWPFHQIVRQTPFPKRSPHL